MKKKSLKKTIVALKDMFEILNDIDKLTLQKLQDQRVRTAHWIRTARRWMASQRKAVDANVTVFRTQERTIKALQEELASIQGKPTSPE